jgi:hypothetical protein
MGCVSTLTHSVPCKGNRIKLSTWKWSDENGWVEKSSDTKEKCSELPLVTVMECTIHCRAAPDQQVWKQLHSAVVTT